MSASRELKDAGLSGGVKQASEMCGKTTDTIQNWYKHNNGLFQIIKLGCVEMLRQQKIVEKAMAERNR